MSVHLVLLQAVLAALSNIMVVRCHSIHALLSSLDELAQQANSNVSEHQGQ